MTQCGLRRAAVFNLLALRVRVPVASIHWRWTYIYLAIIVTKF